jgi:Icc-related predicted phosphoesterase
MKTIIHVNQHIIKANRKNNTNNPVLTIKTYKENRYAHEVEINGPPKGILDKAENRDGLMECCGDKSLLNKLLEVQPAYHLFGHIHNCSGIVNAGMQKLSICDTFFSNGSVVTDRKFGKLSSNGNILVI